MNKINGYVMSFFVRESRQCLGEAFDFGLQQFQNDLIIRIMSGGGIDRENRAFTIDGSFERLGIVRQV